METRRYHVTLTGETPLLMHQDNISWGEAMKRWESDPANKDASIAGDDRSPAWRWIGGVYHDHSQLVVPSDNLMTVLREGGKRCPTGKGQQTFKSQTQSGIVMDQPDWPLTNGGQSIPYAPIKALVTNADFTAHECAALDLGFALFVKRAKIGRAKHVRVRARFDRWECQGTMTVLDAMITKQVLTDILTFAGRYCGLGDWRPSSPSSPGPFGKFIVTVKEAK